MQTDPAGPETHVCCLPAFFAMGISGSLARVEGSNPAVIPRRGEHDEVA